MSAPKITRRVFLASAATIPALPVASAVAETQDKAGRKSNGENVMANTDNQVEQWEFGSLEWVQAKGRDRLFALAWYATTLQEIETRPPALLPPDFLTCRQVNRTAEDHAVELAFHNNGPYGTVEVFRGCEKILHNQTLCAFGSTPRAPGAAAAGRAKRSRASPRPRFERRKRKTETGPAA